MTHCGEHTLASGFYHYHYYYYHYHPESLCCHSADNVEDARAEQTKQISGFKSCLSTHVDSAYFMIFIIQWF